MAKSRKYEQVTIDGMAWNVHPKKATINGEKVIIGYSHSPVLDKAPDDETAHAQLEALVNDGVYTWRQILDGLYDIVLQQHGTILNEYNKAASGNSFKLESAMKAFPEMAAEYDNFEQMVVAMRERWNDENRGDVSNWNPDEHKLFPRDVR